MSKYALIHGTLVELNSDELAHWKYVRKEQLPNGEWKYYYLITKNKVVNPDRITQNYDKSEYKVKDMTPKEVSTHRKSVRLDRYMQAASAWLDSRFSRSVGDLLSGRNKPISWEQAKEVADSQDYAGDPATFISKKYRKTK